MGRNDSRFTPLDSANGDPLWDFETDTAVNETASTFEHGGHQYVVVLAAGSVYPGTKHGDSLWLFSLDGSFSGATSGSRPGAADPRTGPGD